MNTPETESPLAPPPLPAAAAPRARLHFLEGIRGLAALYVTLGHANQQVGYFDMSHPLRLFARSLKFGHYAVAVFIVLSGYCLMLPVARSADGTLRGGFWPYIGRRARRILPPYFFVLFAVLAVIALVPRLQEPSGILWDATLGSLTTGSIVSHLLLVHNFDQEWVLKIDAPMWSVATEWQIYFAFPLLLWAWRRHGMAATVTAAFAVGYGIFFLSRETGGRPTVEACPWYLGLFALGMAAAHRSTHAAQAPAGGRVWPWGAAALAWGGAALAFAVLERKSGVLDGAHIPQRVFLDFFFGFATACLIVMLANATHPASQRRNPLLHVLESRPLMWLGSFSYTLYLVNDPLLAWMSIAMKDAGVADITRYCVTMGAGVPAVLGMSYLMYLAVERRFLNRGK